MGRYKYDRFKGRFSDETIKAIISDLKGTADFNEEDYDWTLLDIRVKKANKAQRHRFADTIRKLEEYVNQNTGNEFEISKGGITLNHRITVREFSEITGRNRKTVEDWMRKGFISYIDRGRSYYRLIYIEKAIEELKNIFHQQL